MCFGALFSGHKRKSSRSVSGERRRSEQPKPPRQGASILAEAPERQSLKRPNKKRPRKVHQGISHRAHPSSGMDYARPSLAVRVPSMWYRSVGSKSSDSSGEMLLNPRPHRSTHDRRQHHVKNTSQSTLRGRGAKRQHTMDVRHDSSCSATIPPNVQKKGAQCQTSGSSTRRYRSVREYHPVRSGNEPELSRSQRHRSQSLRQHPSTRPNTAMRRDPDRRFAVLAATNTALVDLGREAFAQPSPPPRTDRLRRYQGVAIPASRVPFDWDCISSQSSARYEGPSRRQR